MRKQKGFTMYIVAALLAVLAAGALAGWLYHKDTQATIADLTAQNVALTIQVEADKLIIAQAQEDARQQKIINDVVNKQFAKTRVQVEELRGILKKKNAVTGKERDIGKLAIRNPKGLSRVFTNGTKEAFRCVELASGAKHTTAELEATRRSQINDLCKEFANPNYLPH